MVGVSVCRLQMLPMPCQSRVAQEEVSNYELAPVVDIHTSVFDS